MVRNVTGSNGLEAYRMLIQQNEPVSNNRSMGLLNVITNWPAFTGKLSLMQQLLRLEHAFAEYEKLGTKLNEDLKTAILMRSLTGQLKVWLQLQVNESTTYAKVREMVLLYDSSTTKWSEQMVLGTDSAMSSAEGPVPMEIDRVQYKGKSKGSKGKSKIIQRESQKEKERTKMEKEKESLQIRIRRVQRETQFAKRSIQGQRKRRLKSMLRMWAHWSHGYRLLAFWSGETGWFRSSCRFHGSSGITIFFTWWDVQCFSTTASSASIVVDSVQGCKDL